MSSVKDFLKSDYLKNILRLFSGTSLSQIIPILISPLLTRLYSADQFGYFATYVSIYTVLSVITTGRYDQAIILSKTKDEFNELVSICFVFLLFTSIVFGVSIMAIQDSLVKYVDFETHSYFIFLIPLSTFLVGTIQISNYVMIKERAFKRLSYVKVMQTLLVSALTVAFGFLLFNEGLIVGQIAGMLMISAVLIYWIVSDPNHEFVSDLKRIRKALTTHKNFPKFDIAATFLSVGTPQSIVLLLGAFFSKDVVGVYALTNRVLLAPIYFISKSIVDVFREQATKDYYEKGSCRGIYLKTMLLLSAMGIVPFTVLFFWGDTIFSLVFGADWIMAGKIAMILSPMYLLKFVSSPLSYVLYIAGKQKANLFYQLSIFVSIVSMLFLGQFIEDYLIVFKAISLCYSLFYIIYLIQSYRLTIRKQ